MVWIKELQGCYQSLCKQIDVKLELFITEKHKFFLLCKDIAMSILCIEFNNYNGKWMKMNRQVLVLNKNY